MNASELFDAFANAQLTRFYGVPDSTLAAFTELLDDQGITVNEGTAVASAIGYHLATGDCAVVYMQNSGLGNAINPLLSLADPEVMGIPMVLLIGWRGTPTMKDEPQHRKQGRVTTAMLDAMEIPWRIANSPTSIADAAKAARTERKPQAVLIKQGTFAPPSYAPTAGLQREQAIETIARASAAGSVFVATTGKIGRELFEIRDRHGTSHDLDVLIVGAMGHASTIAATIASELENRPVIVLDGDGALLMHMGSLAWIGTQDLHNFTHVVLDNGAHESVGGQPTASRDIDMCAVAKACGYATAELAHDENELTNASSAAQQSSGPHFIQVRVALGGRDDLGRPSISPSEAVRKFGAAVHTS